MSWFTWQHILFLVVCVYIIMDGILQLIKCCHVSSLVWAENKLYVCINIQWENIRKIEEYKTFWKVS